MTIDWNDTIIFNPKSGIDLEEGEGGIIIPAYGNYGGPQISGPGKPVDALDALFKVHDRAIAGVMEDGLIPAELVTPHAALITGIVGSEKTNISGLEETEDGLLVVGETTKAPAGDAEATIYAALTIFALTAELAQLGLLHQLETALDPKDPLKFDDVPRALHEASGYVENGLEEASAAGKGLHGAFQLFEKEFVEILGIPDASLSSGPSDFIL